MNTVVIAGYGLEGRENLRYYRQHCPQARIIVADEHDITDAPEGAEVVTQPDVFATLDKTLQLSDPNETLVVRTAGLAPYKLQTKANVWSATNEFFARCPAPIIGVTGTKGKGTTASFIAAILRTAGKKVHLVGNIGVPALKELDAIAKDDVVVYELSSFQLWDVERSPHIAVVLMIEPDHLNVHRDFADYITAKAQITAHQRKNDVIVYHPTNTYSAQVAGKTAVEVVKDTSVDGIITEADMQRNRYHSQKQAQPVRSIRYNSSDEGSVRVYDGYFYAGDEQLAPITAVKLPGAHNLENATAAITAVRAFDETITPEAIATGLAAFTGLDHRLKFVARKRGVAFYDDSISTTPGSAVAALKAFAAPKILLLGGAGKGADYTLLARQLHRDTHGIRAVIFMGENGPQLLEELRVPISKAHHIPFVPGSGQDAMNQAVLLAATLARPDDVVILSPASASFDLYANYSQRGEAFVQAVQKLT